MYLIFSTLNTSKQRIKPRGPDSLKLIPLLVLGPRIRLQLEMAQQLHCALESSLEHEPVTQLAMKALDLKPFILGPGNSIDCRGSNSFYFIVTGVRKKRKKKKKKRKNTRCWGKQSAVMKCPLQSRVERLSLACFLALASSCIALISQRNREKCREGLLSAS